MTGQLLPFRLLYTRGALAFLSTTLSVRSRGSALRRAPRGLIIPAAAFSTARSLSGRKPMERGKRWTDFRTGASVQGKSLVDDEAELSEWISGLTNDPTRNGRGVDDEEMGGNTRKRDRGGSREVSFSSKRERDLDGFSDFSVRRKLPNVSRGSNLKRFSRNSEDEEDGFRSSRRGNISRGRGGKVFESRYGPGRERRRSFVSASEDEDGDDDDEDDGVESGIPSGRRKGSFSTRRGGKVSESRYGPAKGERSRSFLVASDEEKDVDNNNKDNESDSRLSSEWRKRSILTERGGKVFKSRNDSGRGERRKSFFAASEEEEDGDDVNWNDGAEGGIPSGRRKGSISTGRGDKVYESRYGPGKGARRRSFLTASEEVGDEDEISGSDDDFFGDKDSKKSRSVEDMLKSFSASGNNEANVAPTKLSSESERDSYLSQSRFDDCALSPSTLKGVKSAGYERMTVVQEATHPVILKGKDVLAKAKTGTGKTVAFLLPAIEVVSKLPLPDRDQKRQTINVLIICPTRELAIQASSEAEKLLKYHSSIGVQVVIGGTRLSLEQKRMQTNPCQFLVATPGRLVDHIENTPGFATRLMGVKVLVLDEADRLLDMGFRKDIERVVAAVPRQRQTLLFSATVPDEVRQICYIAMKRDYEFVNTVEEGSEETHVQVRQMHLVVPLEKHFPMLYSILTEHISEDVDYKVIIFCTTAMTTKFVADLLSELHLNVREIHSRKTQTYRTRVSKEFKESKGLILVSSDVSARGVDYPDVTLVIQLGVPADREQYIHRLGRTGRKGKEGKGILMLAPWEDFFLSTIKNLPLTKATPPLVDPDTQKKVERAMSHVDMRSKELAYQAWLGYYNSNKNVGGDKHHLVSLAAEFSRSMGLDNPPAIPKLVLRKMGLNNIPGLRAK